MFKIFNNLVEVKNNDLGVTITIRQERVKGVFLIKRGSFVFVPQFFFLVNIHIVGLCNDIIDFIC